MATEVYTTEEVRLLDETEVELRPLPIAKLRKFMRMWSEHIKSVQEQFAEAQASGDDDAEVKVLNEADITDAQFDVFIKMCALGLESQLKGDKTDKQFLAYLEDVLDEQTIYRVLFKTGGLTVGGDDAPNQIPPNLTADGLN